MSNIEKLQWIPKLFDAYAEIKKVYDAHQQQQQEAEGPMIPEGSHASREGTVVVHSEAPVHRSAVKRKRSVKRTALESQVRETRRQLVRLELMQQHLRDIQTRLDKQLADMEKKVEKKVEKGGGKPQATQTAAPKLFPRNQ